MDVSDTPKILIVDDEPTNVKLLMICFQKEGFQVISASNGADGFLLAKKEHPDLILLDIMMPGESGLQVCARLKDDNATTDIPIIFLSAMDDVKSKVEGLSIGAVDYITKPFELREVTVRARLHIRLSRAHQALINQQRERLLKVGEAQQSILIKPQDLPEARFESFYRPLNEAGGDFYDVVKISEGIYGYLVADVSGHDLGAAFVTAALKALFRQNATPFQSPMDTMKMINSVLHTILTDGDHLTACYVHLNRLTSRLTVISAGHPPVLCGNESRGTAEFLAAEGDVLGPFESVYLKPLERKVVTGDRFFLYTDGLIETETGGYSRGAGKNNLMNAYLGTSGMPMSESVATIMSNLYPEGRPVKDDLLLLGIMV